MSLKTDVALDDGDWPEPLAPETPTSKSVSTKIRYPSQDSPEDELALGYSSERKDFSATTSCPSSQPIYTCPPESEGSMADSKQNGQPEFVLESVKGAPPSRASSPGANTNGKRNLSPHDTTSESAERRSPKKPRFILKQPASSRSKYDNPDEMLTNPRAPLGTVDLRDLLCSEAAWLLLNADEKMRVLAMFPDQEEVLNPGTDSAKPDIASLRNNNHFRHDIARYQENLRQGRHDPDWIRQAQVAHRQRQLGFYNEFAARRFEESWGMKIPSDDVSHDDPGTKDEQDTNKGHDAPEGGKESLRPDAKANGSSSTATLGFELNGQTCDGSTPGLTEDKESEDGSLLGGTPGAAGEKESQMPSGHEHSPAPDPESRTRGTKLHLEMTKPEQTPIKP